MKESDLKKRTKEILKNKYQEMIKKIDKAILSGFMNIDGADDNYVLPRKLAIAILKDVFESEANYVDKKTKTEINNIYLML